MHVSRTAPWHDDIPTESKVKHVMMHWQQSMPKLRWKQGKRMFLNLARREMRING